MTFKEVRRSQHRRGKLTVEGGLEECACASQPNGQSRVSGRRMRSVASWSTQQAPVRTRLCVSFLFLFGGFYFGLCPSGQL